MNTFLINYSYYDHGDEFHSSDIFKSKENLITLYKKLKRNKNGFLERFSETIFPNHVCKLERIELDFDDTFIILKLILNNHFIDIFQCNHIEIIE